MKVGQIIIDKINEYQDACEIRSYKHKQIAAKYKTLYVWLTVPTLIVSAVSTLIASYNSQKPDKSFAIIAAVFIGVTTILNSILAFFEFNKKYQEHVNISNKFMELAIRIDFDLCCKYYALAEQKDDPKESVAFIQSFLVQIEKELINIQSMITDILPSNLEDKSVGDIPCGINKVKARDEKNRNCAIVEQFSRSDTPIQNIDQTKPMPDLTNPNQNHISLLISPNQK